MSTLELGTLQAELGGATTQTGNFTPVTVTANYTVAGQPGQGTVTFTLTQPIYNGNDLVPASPLIVTLDANGNLSATLLATDNAGTLPQGVWYGVTEQIDNAQPRDYFIAVSSLGPNPLTLQPPGVIPWL